MGDAIAAVARFAFSLLLATHGWQKFQTFDTLAQTFPDPMGVGSELSLMLAIFGELLCAIAAAFGFLTRLTLIPMAFTMGVAFFIAHNGSVAEGGELALLYLIAFICLWFAGAGRYSIDRLVFNKLAA